nr:hypothetical protein [Solanum melongena]
MPFLPLIELNIDPGKLTTELQLQGWLYGLPDLDGPASHLSVHCKERLKRKKEAFGGHKPSGLDTWTPGSLPQGPSFGTALFLSKVEFLLAFPFDLCQTPLLLLPGGMIHSTSVSATKTPFSVE